MIAFTTAAVAQSTAETSAATGARVITPITITMVEDMNFGNLVATVAGGEIVLPISGARTGDDAILLGTQNGTIKAASFTVTGETNFTYAITLPPTSFNVSSKVGEITSIMSVGTFVSSPSGTGTLSASGTQPLIVGATITLGANQVSGTYTNADALAITVNYN